MIKSGQISASGRQDVCKYKKSVPFVCAKKIIVLFFFKANMERYHRNEPVEVVKKMWAIIRHDDEETEHTRLVKILQKEFPSTTGGMVLLRGWLFLM